MLNFGDPLIWPNLTNEAVRALHAYKQGSRDDDNPEIRLQATHVLTAARHTQCRASWSQFTWA
jgi:hypothetical protein